MRILIAPDKFAGTLSASEAAEAIAVGWLKTAPEDQLDLCPVSDGGPGFLDTLSAALPASELSVVTVSGPLGDSVPATILVDGDTAYIEVAQACGLHLLESERQDPTVTTSFGVGELVAEAVDGGINKLVIGLGGSGTNDAGAGMLAALGATADGPLDQGGLALSGVSTVDLEPVRARLEGIELVAASDVDNPLLGLTGASKTYGKQKGASDEDIMRLEGALEMLVEAIGRRADGKQPAVAKGSGAAGGLGYALLHLGSSQVPGISTIMDIVGFDARVSQADLVITGEGRFDWQSLRGKVVSGVAAASMSQARPCVVLAGDVSVGRREYSQVGISNAYSVATIMGSLDESMEFPSRSLIAAAERIARTWSR